MAEGKATRSRRQARQAVRSARGQGVGRPCILRNIPTYDVLSDENLARIEAAADRILAETGIEFRDDPEALDHWRRAGAKVDGVLVRFEPGLLREVLKTAPASFTQHARNPAKSPARVGMRPRVQGCARFLGHAPGCYVRFASKNAIVRCHARSAAA